MIRGAWNMTLDLTLDLTLGLVLRSTSENLRLI